MRNLGWLVAPFFLMGASPSKPIAPSGWGCTAETLASGDRCVFEGSADTGPGAPLGNIAETMCSLHLAPADKTSATDAVEAHCRSEVANATKEACSAKAALLDDQGRFLPSAKECYRALTEVRQRAEWQASTLAPCCACLAEQHCVAAANTCVESASASSSVEASNTKCAMSACENACIGIVPDQAEAPTAPAKTRVSHR